MSELDLDSLVARARRAVPRDGVKAQLRGRIVGAALGGIATSAVVNSAAASAFKGVLTWFAAGAALGVLVGAPAVLLLSQSAASTAGLQRQTALPTQPGESSRSDAPAPQSPSPRSSDAARGASDVPVEPAPQQTSNLPQPSRRASTAVASTPAAQVPSIQRETEIVTEAQRALQRGDASSALAWLDRYDAEFPRGGLAEEALAARAVATCTHGQADASRRTVAQFRRRYAASPLLPRVDAACRKWIEP